MRANPFFAFLLSPLFLLAACASSAAQLPDTLVLAIGGESEDGYDPATGWGRYGHPLFHSTLLTRDERLDIHGDLATEWRLSDDRLTWTISLRDDVVFSDGVPLTAEDVAFTFRQAANSGGRVDLSVMRDIVPVGPHQVKIHLHRPEITFIDHLLKLGIVPRHAYAPGYSRRPVGSGPYALAAWDEGQQLIVEANALYYGERPAFRRLVFLFMGEDAAFAAARAGRVHLVAVPQNLAGQTVPGMRLHPVKSVDNRGIMFPVLPDTGRRAATGAAIGNNVTADPAIRKAVNYAVNRQILVKGVLHGHGEPAFGMVDGLPWDNPEIRFADNNLARARQILAEAGWADADGDGILEKNGLCAAFRLVYPAGDTVRQSLALAVRDQVRPAGIDVEPVAASWDAVYAQHSFNSAVLYGWGGTSPLEMYRMYHSRPYDDNADSTSFNSGRYANPAVDAHLDAAQRAGSFEESLPHWRLAQWDGAAGPAVAGDAAWAWLVNLTHTYFVDDRLDIGVSATEPHGHGWPITANVVKWRWKGE